MPDQLVFINWFIQQLKKFFETNHLKDDYFADIDLEKDPIADIRKAVDTFYKELIIPADLNGSFRDEYQKVLFNKTNYTRSHEGRSELKVFLTTKTKTTSHFLNNRDRDRQKPRIVALDDNSMTALILAFYVRIAIGEKVDFPYFDLARLLLAGRNKRKEPTYARIYSFVYDILIDAKNAVANCIQFIRGITKYKAPPTTPIPFNLILCGPPGTGKTLRANKLTAGRDVKRIQFHSSYAYEHFVQGERFVTLGNERLIQLVDGPLMILYRKATKTFAVSKCYVKKVSGKGGVGDSARLQLPFGLLRRYDLFKHADIEATLDNDANLEIIDASPNVITVKWVDHLTDKEISEIKFRGKSWGEPQHYVLLIDEINRAEAAKVFGELLYAIADLDAPEAKPIALQYSGELFSWPKNLSLLGTMNTADRSIGELDQALKRRFQFEKLDPKPSLLEGEVSKEEFRVYFSELARLQEVINANSTIIEEYEKKKAIQDHEDFTKNRISCDEVIVLFNTISLLKRKLYNQKTVLLPIPSIALTEINTLILNEEQVFEPRSKLIGHSFFIKFAKQVSAELSSMFGSGSAEFARLDKAELSWVDDIVKSQIHQQVVPQLYSVCNEDHKLVTKILKRWAENAEKNTLQMLAEYCTKELLDDPAPLVPLEESEQAA